jgi:imidazolonepropionase-like amidohydrolase
MKQQIDPISQAMQILQLVTQRQGQRADIDQGQQRLDIARQGMRMDRRQGRQQREMQQQQFNTGLSWDREQALMRQKQFETEQSRAMLEAAQRMAMDERKLGAEEAWRKAQMQEAQQRQNQFQVGAISELLPSVQNQAMMLQQDNPPEAQYQQELAKQMLQAIYQKLGLQMPERPQVDPQTQALYGQ